MSSSSISQYKLVLLGDSGVGKSSLLHRFVTDTFDFECAPTIGASFMSKTITVDSRMMKFNIWDTAGQERYRALTKMYYRDATVALLVFDLSNPESVRSLETWRQEITEHGPKAICLAVAGNKEDAASGSDAEAQSWAKRYGAIYKRTSAKNNVGVLQLFVEIARALISCRTTSIRPRTSAIYLKPKNERKGASCCSGSKQKDLSPNS